VNLVLFTLVLLLDVTNVKHLATVELNLIHAHLDLPALQDSPGPLVMMVHLVNPVKPELLESVLFLTT